MCGTEQTGVAEKEYELCTRNKVVISVEKSVLQLSFLDAFAELRKETISFVMPIRPHETMRLPLDGFYIRVYFENLSRKFQFYKNVTRITGTLRTDQYIYIYI